MKKKTSRLKKASDIYSNKKIAEWCYVNTENEFTFRNITMVIDESVEQYKVHNKAGEVKDYTNEALMEDILVVVDSGNAITFYDQYLKQIENHFIRVKV